MVAIPSPCLRTLRGYFFSAQTASLEPIRKPLMSRDCGSFRGGTGGRAGGIPNAVCPPRGQRRPTRKEPQPDRAPDLLPIRHVAGAGDSPSRDTPRSRASRTRQNLWRHGHHRFPDRLLAASRPAASPSAMHVPMTRVAPRASRVAEIQRPAHSRFAAAADFRHRNGISQNSPAFR